MNSPHPTLNEQTFSIFCDMMGDNVDAVIALHRKTTQGYLHTIRTSLASGNFSDLWKTAHTIKSANANLGAERLVHIAREMEMLGQAPSSDHSILTGLATQLEDEVRNVDAAIERELALRVSRNASTK